MQSLISYIDEFSSRKILVLGDLIADEFIEGSPERLSREAPVLILRQQKRKILPGGAANAANNICSLGGNVLTMGLVGDDEPGQTLLKTMNDRGIDVTSVIRDSTRPTTIKTRVLAGGKQVVKQQIVRIDHLDNTELSYKNQEIFFSRFNNMIEDIDGVLLSDYGNGVFSKELVKKIIKKAEENGVFTAVDSRYNLMDFRGVKAATPNLEEAGRIVGDSLVSQNDVVKAGNFILDKMKLEYLLITQGGDGMTLFEKGGSPRHIPVANFSEVYDVTGAGDTVVGTFLLALISGARPMEAVHLSNYAAGIVVRKSGVATVTPLELKKEVLEDEE